MYTTYHILKRYIKHKQNIFITLPISNIMIKKITVYIYYYTVFQ